MQNILLFGSTLYHLLFYFFIYSFLGWCLEEAFVAAETGQIVNRGFLNGPVCPIYGCGALLITLSLNGLSGNLLLLYLAGVLLASALEYIGGVVLEKLFHTRWWDYSNLPLNLQGHICLKFSLLWGLGCVILIKLIHPAVIRVVSLVPYPLGNTILAALTLIFLFDLVVTVRSTMHLNRYLKELEQLSGLLRTSSEQLGTAISREAMELKEKYEKLTDAYRASTARLIRAFPDMKSLRHDAILTEIKNKIQQVRKLGRK